MRAVVDANAFYEALKKANTATSKTRHNIPTKQVCVSIRENACRLIGTDLTSWLVAGLPAQGDDFSFVLADTGKMLRVCKYYSGELSLELTVIVHPYRRKDMKLSLCCGGRSAEFAVFEDQGIHDPPQIEESTETYTVNAASLLNRVERVRYAASRSDSRPAMRSVRFQDKRIWCIDGMRIAVNTSEQLTVSRPFALPVSALLYLSEFGKTDVTLRAGEEYAVFTGSGISLFCLVAKPSDSVVLEQVIPGDLPERFQIDRKQYLNEIKYLCECVDAGSDAPVLFDKGRLILFGNGAVFRTSLDVAGECSDQFALNPRYIREALKQFSGNRYVTLHSGGRFSPVVITADGADTALILPVRASKSWERLDAAA